MLIEYAENKRKRSEKQGEEFHIAGCCCVRQWIVPKPKTRSTQWMPTMARSVLS